MPISADDARALAELDFRLRIVLPEEYQETYENIQPASMGSVGLRYAPDGSVAWDEIWVGFCDLAMAGGPPHKGTLLQPGFRSEIDARPDRYREVVDEICRGVTLVTDLPADGSVIPGWIRVDCYSEGMAAWLLRAIVMENVAAHAEGRALGLPAAPAFRLEKEIKNVITVIAKTCHYYVGHMPRGQKASIASLFTTLSAASPLIEPAMSENGHRSAGDQALYSSLAERIHRQTGLGTSSREYAGWLGVECPSVKSAVWMMRALVVSNVLSRREGMTLFVPVNPDSDPEGTRVSSVLARIHQLSSARDLAGD